jgi:hypothetical protein
MPFPKHRIVCLVSPNIFIFNITDFRERVRKTRQSTGELFSVRREGKGVGVWCNYETPTKQKFWNFEENSSAIMKLLWNRTNMWKVLAEVKTFCKDCVLATGMNCGRLRERENRFVDVVCNFRTDQGMRYFIWPNSSWRLRNRTMTFTKSCGKLVRAITKLATKPVLFSYETVSHDIAHKARNLGLWQNVRWGWVKSKILCPPMLAESRIFSLKSNPMVNCK